ncbi:beta strand repeat-containing protein [Flavobacterium sp.]|uniref:beta strand repeat-containing protein n=1 Tax=Flavobacterium sp. TaxID=239 RepID=UPI0040475A52
MKNLYVILLLSVFSNCFSQVGIGTTNPNAALDVSSTTQGFLLPRVSLTASNVALPVVNPAGGVLANGTMVYNTETAGVFPNNVLPGYYYWNGYQWIRLNADASWITHGNTGTNAATNFLGTLDNVDLVFKRNNLFSGRLNTSNTSFGVESFSNAATTAQRTVAIGVNALKNVTSGNDNVAVGYGTLESNTTGLQNIAIGTSALTLNSSGSYNTAIGYEAMTRNTSGILNTAVGSTSLFNNLMGNNNVGIGYATLQRNFSGSRNAAVGTNALFNNQTGNNNVGVGDSALERNISGSNNVAVGRNSLFNNQGTSNNTSIGTESQLNNLSGQNNTSLGYQALFSNNAGSSNVSIGNLSLYSNASGSRNIAIGENSGTNITTGNNNTFLGHNTGTTISTGSNNTIVGSNVSLPAATSNNIVLADGAGNRRINVDQNGNVGINTSTQTVKLEVNGAAANSSTFNAGASTTIDLATSNLAVTSASTNAITLTNLKDGAAYTIIFSSTTATAGNVIFTATGFTFAYMGTFPRVSGKRHIYSIIVAGTVCYVSMSVEN